MIFNGYDNAGWTFSDVITGPAGVDFTVSYTLYPFERRCCHEVTVDRYVRFFIMGGLFGPWRLDHSSGGGYNYIDKPHIGYAEGDAPDGPGFIVIRIPWQQMFKFEARCTKGPWSGKILSREIRIYESPWHFLWTATKPGRWL